MITTAAYVADTARLEEQLRRVEGLNAAWQALRREFATTAAAARDTQTAGKVAGDARIKLASLDQQLTAIERHAIEILEELYTLIVSIGDA